jgi:hypothetical protein
VESVEATIQELQTLLVMIDKQMDAVIDVAMLSAKAQSLSSLIYLSGGY